jgi:hypothetical protein
MTKRKKMIGILNTPIAVVVSGMRGGTAGTTTQKTVLTVVYRYTAS